MLAGTVRNWVGCCMNKYQRRESKEIKRIMKLDKFGRTTYRQAKCVEKELIKVKKAVM